MHLAGARGFGLSAWLLVHFALPLKSPSLRAWSPRGHGELPVPACHSLFPWMGGDALGPAGSAGAAIGREGILPATSRTSHLVVGSSRGPYCVC